MSTFERRFAGKSNAGLRAKIRETVRRAEGSPDDVQRAVLSLSGAVALTAQGERTLRDVAEDYHRAAMRSAPMDIVYRSSLDWGIEHTDADAAAFCSAVANAIQSFYPNATVEVEEHLGDSRACVTMSDGSYKGLENVELIVNDIARRVWDDNDFWPKARRAAKVRR